MAEAEALAVTISVLLLMPEAVEALKQMILVAWAGGESVMDLRCLLDGRKVPLVKSADKWVVSLSQLPLLLTDGGSVREMIQEKESDIPIISGCFSFEIGAGNYNADFRLCRRGTPFQTYFVSGRSMCD